MPRANTFVKRNEFQLSITKAFCRYEKEEGQTHTVEQLSVADGMIRKLFTVDNLFRSRQC